MDEHGRRSLGAPKRLSEGDPASLETRLVRAARAEAPPSGASGRAMAALGLGAVAATSVVAGSAAASTAAASTAAASTTTASTAATTTIVAGKGFLGASVTTWIAGGAIAVAATGGVLALDASRSPTPTSTVASLAPSAASGVEVRAPAPVPAPAPITSARPMLEEVATIQDPPSAAAAAAPPRASAPPAASARPGPSALSREVELIDGARAALAGGDPAGALAILDRYDREHPGGALAPEAALLRTKARARIEPAP